MDNLKSKGKRAGCQVMLDGDIRCRKKAVMREIVHRYTPKSHWILLRVRVCGKCWEGK